MSQAYHYLTNAQLRAKRVRSRMHGTPQRPRVSVFRSNKYFFAQAIDDTIGKAIIGMSDRQTAATVKENLTKSEAVKHLAVVFGKELSKKKITKICFDRGSLGYLGRIRTFAEALRGAGINF